MRHRIREWPLQQAFDGHAGYDRSLRRKRLGDVSDRGMQTGDFVGQVGQRLWPLARLPEAGAREVQNLGHVANEGPRRPHAVSRVEVSKRRGGFPHRLLRAIGQRGQEMLQQ